MQMEQMLLRNKWQRCNHFLTWAAEPHLEQRHKMGVKVLIFLIILTTLVYFKEKTLVKVDTEV